MPPGRTEGRRLAWGRMSYAPLGRRLGGPDTTQAPMKSPSAGLASRQGREGRRRPPKTHLTPCGARRTVFRFIVVNRHKGQPSSGGERRPSRHPNGRRYRPPGRSAPAVPGDNRGHGQRERKTLTQEVPSARSRAPFFLGEKLRERQVTRCGTSLGGAGGVAGHPAGQRTAPAAPCHAARPGGPAARHGCYPPRGLRARLP